MQPMGETVNDDFNPLHHEGGDELDQFTGPESVHFNPLHHEGGDGIHDEISGYSRRFQSTPPRGWRQGITVGLNALKKFQSTPPRGWRQYIAGLKDIEIRFQSTPPRGWRLMTYGLDVPSITISIHSTTRVETSGTPGLPGDTNLFQSTPPRGWRRGSACHHVLIHAISIHSTTRVETSQGNPLYALLANFNPLHHEGGDQQWEQGYRRRFISIHSTTRVETMKLLRMYPITKISIHSTTRVETFSYASGLVSFRFQSTPPRGWRRRALCGMG